MKRTRLLYTGGDQKVNTKQAAEFRDLEAAVTGFTSNCPLRVWLRESIFGLLISSLTKISVSYA